MSGRTGPMFEAYERQAAEWQKIGEELKAKCLPGEGVTAFRVTLELRKRLLARGEHFVTYDDLVREFGEGGR